MRWFSNIARRWHVYISLYFLLFLWLFCISGLVLNHGEWKFAEFWPQRQQSQYERSVSAATTPELMAQLGIHGEVTWTQPVQPPGRLRFRVSKPGVNYEVDVDLDKREAKVQETRVSFWGVMSALHHFNGVHAGDERNSRDWLMTTLWVVSMDALAAGILFIAFSGICFWWLTGRRRVAGALTLAAGTAICCLLLWL